MLHEISPWLPDLRVPRMSPCEAEGIGPGRILCGATPASLWRRWCFNGHERRCWLCPVHAKMIAHGLAQCSDCTARGVTAAAWLSPLDLIMLGHAGEG